MFDSAKGFSDFIAPLERASFRDLYWEQRPTRVARSDAAYYASLLTLADVDHILATSVLDSSTIRVVGDAEEIPIADLIGLDMDRVLALERVYEQYRAGRTIVLTALHERWPALTRLCRSFTEEVSAGLQANAYLTPPGHVRGLGIHYDTHDVFIAQLAGRKHWKLYNSPVQLPLKDNRYRGPRDETAEEPTEEFDLEAGDLLYLPRGFLHVAESTDTASLHITVGVVPVTWAYVFRAALEDMIGEDASFRKALPWGFAKDVTLQREALVRFNELQEVFRGGSSPARAVENAATRARIAMRPSLDGHLLDLDSESAVRMETPLRARQDLTWRLRAVDSYVDLEFHGKVVRLPAFVEGAVRYIGETHWFTPRDIPGPLDDEGRAVLARRLLHEGFLTHIDVREGASLARTR